MKHAAVAGWEEQAEKLWLKWIRARPPLDFVFVSGGLAVSCFALFHVILSFHATEMTEYLSSVLGLTDAEAGAMRDVQGLMVRCSAVQMLAAVVAWTGKGRLLRRAAAFVALVVGARTVWLSGRFSYLLILPELRRFHSFGVLAKALTVVAVGILTSPAASALVLIPLGLRAVVAGDEGDWDQ